MNDFRGITDDRNPLVSICLASFNNSQYIEQTLDSIYNQDYSPIELIIIDDHSTDGVEVVIENWIEKKNVDVNVLTKSKTKKGLCSSLNILLLAAKGEYFAPFATDDIMKPDRISKLVSKLTNENSNTALVYSDIELIDQDGNEFINPKKINYKKLEGNVYLELINGTFRFPAVSCLYKINTVRDIGGYDENLRSEDIDMWFRLSELYDFAYLGESLTYYRVHSKSLSQSSLHPRTVRDKAFYFLKHTQSSNVQVKNLARKSVESCLLSLSVKKEHYFYEIISSVFFTYFSFDLLMILLKTFIRRLLYLNFKEK